MFRKLRLRLTLINVLVMGLLCILLITSTYLIMDRQIFVQSQQLMELIASDAGSGTPATSLNALQETTHDHRDRSKYFYVKTNENGDITETSTDSPLPSDQLKILVQKTLTHKNPQGTVGFKDITFSFLHVPIQNNPGQIIVFMDLEHDRDILNILLGTLAIGGVIYLAFAFYGSLFLADRALIPIKKSWQKQQDFVADASHELRTPLAVIQTNMELVRGNPEESVESQTKWLENIQHETRRMSKLVEDLLFLARADSEQLPLDMKNFNLSYTLLSTLSSFEAMARNQGITLESIVQDHILFYGDENRIRQLIVNLVDNALKHTPAGGNISIRLTNSGPSIEMTVSDTGEGIEPEYLEKIFERFYRVDKARSKMTGGTGLGLSIADWITKVHHGRITATSHVGEGTTFVVNLPHCGNKKTKENIDNELI